MRLNFKFIQTDGVPLTADLMDQIQEAYAIFNVIGGIAGHLTILSGCEVNGTLVNPGIVAINGDVLSFDGGTLDQTVYIYQEDITKVFKNQVSKVLIEKKTVRFGNASVTYNWGDFVRIPTLKEMKTAIEGKVNQTAFDLLVARVEKVEQKTAPIINGGVVFPWRKPAADIPDGWKECTDLRGKTIVGLDPDDNIFNTLGNSVGSKTHKLSVSELPEHDHGVLEYAGAGTPAANSRLNANVTGQFSSSRTTKTGGNAPHNNIQPSHIALFIEPNFQ